MPDCFCTSAFLSQLFPSSLPRLPGFVVVGSMKCGTTSLHHYLSLHPQIHVAPKEINFFLPSETPHALHRPAGNWERGVSWYQSHFQTASKVCGDVSPGLVCAQGRRLAAERLSRLIPNAKLVLLVREPLRRLYSHYCMALGNMEIPLISFAEFVDDDISLPYRAYSHYGDQLACLLDFFPPDSVMVIESDRLDHDRLASLRSLFAFVGVSPDFESPGFLRRLFDGSTRRLPSPFGQRILGSLPMRWAWDQLPFTLYEKLRHSALTPFSSPPPPMHLPMQMMRQLRQEFDDQVFRLRQLCGDPLPSLGK